MWRIEERIRFTEESLAVIRAAPVFVTAKKANVVIKEGKDNKIFKIRI